MPSSPTIAIPFPHDVDEYGKIMSMKKRALAAAVLATFAAFAQQTVQPETYEIGDDLAKSTENWEQSAEDFAVEHGKSAFRFAESRRRDVVVCRHPDAVTFFGTPVMETRIYFKNRAIAKVELSLYNKGDATTRGKVMSGDELEKMVEIVSASITGDNGKPPQTERMRVKNDRMKMGHKFTRKWQKRHPSAELTWGISGEKKSEIVEYARLTLVGDATGNDKAPNVSAQKTKTSGGAKTGAARFADNVKHNDEGDVYVANVPMVDQGDKGYCSVATAERILRYFGQSVDEHELAQIAGTHASGGTSTKAMISAVEMIGKKCKLGKREIVSKLGSWEDGAKRLKAYNAAAKRMKKPELRLDDYITANGNTRTFNIGEMERAMEPKVLKAMSMKDKSGYGKFIKGIRDQTARGVPLFWSVRLGVYPEPGIPQQFGGHMRLIIGYNEEKGEIIYSDSWGAGHERKHMPDDWAWTITMNLFYLNPW